MARWVPDLTCGSWRMIMQLRGARSIGELDRSLIRRREQSPTPGRSSAVRSGLSIQAERAQAPARTA